MIKFDAKSKGNPNKVRLPRKVKKAFLKRFPYAEYDLRLNVNRNAFESSNDRYYLNMYANDGI